MCTTANTSLSKLVVQATPTQYPVFEATSVLYTGINVPEIEAIRKGGNVKKILCKALIEWNVG